MANVEFTEEFNVEEAGQIKYKNFIESLRSRLGETISHELPVLPPQQDPPTQWFEIILRTNTHVSSTTTCAIRLRIRRDNLYLDGYQMQNSNGDFDQWLEFDNNSGQHLIDGSSFLGFDGGYIDLARFAGARIDSINLGQQQLTDAVNQLSNTTDTKKRARSLIIVIQMICESIRFTRISNHLVDSFISGSLPPPTWMLALEHGWQDLSAALLRLDANPEHYFRLPQPNDMEIETYLGAVAVLGILLGCNGRRRAPRMVVVNDGDCPQGRPLVEVFSVRIMNIDGENPGDLYGTITVTDGLSSQYLYNRERKDYESIRQGDTALLTGPSRAISAYGSFNIDVALMDKDSDASPDDEVSKGQISWNVFNINNVYDDPLYDDVVGKYGSVTVNYMVLSNAVEATVEVTLINGDGENPADVYGLLTARNSNFSNESVLFRKASNEHIDIRPNQLIPLSRSVVAVPLNSSLIVHADLWDHDSDWSADDEIAKGTVEFPAQLSDTSEKRIYGKYGEIRVSVTWG